MRNHDTEKDSIIHEIDGNTNIYNKFIKNIKVDEGCIEFIFQGEPNDIIKAISRFIDHPTNRTRIHPTTCPCTIGQRQAIFYISFEKIVFQSASTWSQPMTFPQPTKGETTFLMHNSKCTMHN